jgi:hypothetical protein
MNQQRAVAQYVLHLGSQDYQSSLGNAESRKFETFSYLPTLTAEQMRVQIQYSVIKDRKM